jgi:carboxymethylenebutenolidase
MSTAIPERFAMRAPAGAFDALVVRPAATVAPGVLIIPEVFGRSTHMRTTAADLAAQGFLVGVLDIHWRVAADVALEPHEVERARQLHQQLDYEIVMDDLEAAVKQFRGMPGCSGRLGVVGFCLGGTLTWLAAARTDADACVSYYGTRIPRYIAAAAHIAHPLLMHLGQSDSFTPPPVIEQIAQATADNPLVERHLYPAGHAFCNPAQSGFDPVSTQLAHHRTVAFLNHHLRSSR